jgi:hypothetical protein
MKYFKNDIGDVYAYTDDQIKIGLALDKTRMSDEDVTMRINPIETTEQAISRLEAVTNAFIFAKVDEYNKTNATAFSSIHSCGNYRFDMDYTHQPFCVKVWKWNVNVWETVRAFFLSATAIPADEEFQSVLDGVAF